MEYNAEINSITFSENLNDISSTATSSIIEEIGFGKSQIISLSFFAYGNFICGISLFAWSFFSIVLQNEWDLTINQVNILGSIFFLGFSTSSIVSGPLSNKYGRKNLYLWLVFLIGVNCGLLGMAPNYLFFIIFWLTLGGLVGILTPLIIVMATEVSTTEWRGKTTILVQSAFTLGEFYGLFICYMTFSSLDSGNWRVLFFSMAIPSMLVAIIGIYILEETPIFALHNDFNNGIQIVKYMYKRNKGYDMIFCDDGIQNLRKSLDEEHKLIFKEDNCLSIFSGDYKIITPLLWIIFFTSDLVYSGIMYIYPIILNDLDQQQQSSQNQDFLSIFISILGEIPSYFLASIIIDTSLGRKMSLFWSMLLASLAFIFAYCANGLIFTLLIIGSRTVTNCGINLANPFSAELYHTKLRATGLGIGNALSGLGSILMPWILNTALEKQIMLPFIILGAFSAIAGLATYLLPYDTTGKTLDSKFIAKHQKIDIDIQIHYLIEKKKKS